MDEQLLGDRVVRASFGDQREHFAFAVSKAFKRIVACPAPADELVHDRGVEDRSSMPDAVDARRELVEIGYALFEQVPHAVGPEGE